MSYLVLARKWRPQSFSDVVSQKHVIQALQNAVRLGRLPHALLLTGSRGIGKTTIARIVAKTVNCVNLDPESEFPNPCNECHSCKEITEGNSIDVTEIDGASNRSIDDIRELRENVQYLPNSARRKVYIIDEVHMLTREAFNALLKTLEEPPSHVLFLFATTEPHKIPITILSRCQRFDFKRMTGQELRLYLREISNREGLTVSDTGLNMVARAADGGMRDAMSLLDQVIAFGGKNPSDEDVAQAIGAVDRSLLHQIGAALFARDIDGCLRCIDHLLSHAYDLRQLTQEIANFLRDLMVVLVCKNPEEVTDLASDELLIFQELAKGQSADRIQQMFRILTKAAEEVARANYPRLLLEMTLIQMSRVEPVQPFDDLIRQLSALEHRLEQRLPPGSGGSGSSGSSGPVGGGASGGGSAPFESKMAPPLSLSQSGGFSASSNASSNASPPVSSSVSPVVSNSSPAYASGLQEVSRTAAVSPSVVAFQESPRVEQPKPAPKNGVSHKKERVQASKKVDDSFLPDSLRKLAAKPVSSSEGEGREVPALESTPSSSKESVAMTLEQVEAVLQGRASVHHKAAPVTEEQWFSVVASYREDHPFVGESLQFARYAFDENGTVRLMFPSTSVMRSDRLTKPESREAFELFCKEQGVALKVDITLLETDDLPDDFQYSIWEHKMALRAKKMFDLRKEAEEHPVILDVLQKIPGAEILKVEPLEQKVLEEDEKSKDKG